MRRIESFEDQRRNVATYEFPDGRRIRFDRREVAEHGLLELLRRAGLADQVPTERVAVIQDRQRIGTVPASFDPLYIKSRSPLYQPLPDDFLREPYGWEASLHLGPGDFEAIPDFAWDPDVKKP